MQFCDRPQNYIQEQFSSILFLRLRKINNAFKIIFEIKIWKTLVQETC